MENPFGLRLREQQNLLKKSVAEFLRGDLTEALRIATIIRVLVHESASSVPLLKRLSSSYLELPILDKAEGLPPESKGLPGFRIRIPLGVRMGPDGVSPYVDLKSPSYSLVLLGRWWGEPCLEFPNGPENMEFTRKELVLNLANKEGGAHVDDKLPLKYRALVGQERFQIFWNGQQTDSIHIARWIMGQSGAEMLDCIMRNFGEGT